MQKSGKRNPEKFHSSGEENHEIVSKTFAPVLERLNFKQNEVILDHGCKHGKKALDLLLPSVEKCDGTLYALDHCEATIKFAKKNYPHEKINYIVGDLNLPEGTLGELKFDKIFSFHSLWITPDYRAAIKSMYDHLKPGGQVFLMIVTEVHPFDELNTKLHEDPKWATHHDEHEQLSWPAPDYMGDAAEEKLKEAFTEAGFEIQEFEFMDKSYNFDNPRQLSDYFLSMNAFAGHLSPELHDELEEVYYKCALETPTKTYTPGPNSENEECEFPFVCAHVLVKRPE